MWLCIAVQFRGAHCFDSLEHFSRARVLSHYHSLQIHEPVSVSELIGCFDVAKNHQRNNSRRFHGETHDVLSRVSMKFGYSSGMVPDDNASLVESYLAMHFILHACCSCASESRTELRVSTDVILRVFI